MQTQSNHPVIHISRRSQEASLCLLLEKGRTRRRPVRIALPLPRREACLTRRAMRAALREAEFYDWLHDHNDLRGGMHQPIH